MPTIGWAETRYTGSHRARRDGDRSGERHRSTDTLGCALHDPDGVHRSPRVDVLSVSGCGGSRTRTPARQELAKTGANRVDRATQAGHADFADLGLRDAVAHSFTLSRSLAGQVVAGSRDSHVRACRDSSCRSVSARRTASSGSSPIPAGFGNEFGNETRRHCRDGVERDAMTWTCDPS